ncbi:hypothetical protein LWM68_38030 [Niabella sp. W65]|nr:hypothetical protein [Niabella sp. W65]MCH7368029.1 hypothetical protein [Niabella sp. W65]ULT43054.1 hypothetical protein KRR40_05880 [Niabella sp. I65]
MKLAPVLAQYLATNKVLSLPGLGTFHADSTYNPEVDYSKKAHPCSISASSQPK